MLQNTHNSYGIESYHHLGSVHSCEYLSMFPFSLSTRELTSVGEETGNQNKISGTNFRLGPRLSPSQAKVKPLYSLH